MSKNKLNLENIEKARAYFEEKKPDIFPIVDHPIGKEEEYLQELYISLLCSIAAFDDEIANSETLFIKRIINGIKLKTDYAKLIKLGLEINNQTLDDFINAFSGKSLAYNFIADALLLATSDGVLHDKEVELIAEISEILKITKKEIDTLSQFISVLLLQDQEKLSKFLDDIKIPFDCEYFIKSFSLEMIKTKDIDYYTGEMIFKENKAFLKPIVRFENAKISIKKNAVMIFSGAHKVEFVNCEILGAENNAIQISNVAEVNIIECTFKNFKHRVMHFSKIPKILIKDSHFIQCGYYYDNTFSENGGVFVFNNTNSEITNCVFDSCYLENGSYSLKSETVPKGFVSCYNDSNSILSFNVYKSCFAKNGRYIADDASFYINNKDTCKITELNNIHSN